MLQYRVLGNLEVLAGDSSLALGPPKQRAVLAVLLLNAKQIVPADQLIDLVWGDSPPRTAAHSVQVYISDLRRILSNGSVEEVIQTRPPGYTIDAEPESIDVRCFEVLVEFGTRELSADDLVSGVETLRRALRLWARPLADFAYEEFAQPEVRRLTQLRLDALEELAAAELSLGHEHQVLSLVDTALAADPLRERSRELQMLALYRAGRHAESLRSYERFRVLLADELGLEPSPSIRRLQERVLLHDPSLLPSTEDEARSTRPARNPYKGLRPFGEQDAGDFFGREALVGDLIGALNDGARLVALVGPSGSGKSSVVMAGLIPALRGGAVRGSESWAIRRMVPGQHPFDELDAARRELAGDAELLVVIDQFEELFALTDGDEQRRFLHELVAMVSAPQPSVRVVLTLRADFYERPLLDPEFGPVFTAGVVNAHAMTAAELESAVVGPARRVGAAVAPGLLAELVADTAAQPGGLPLLQYALTELFELSDGGQMARDEYDTIGGLRGLLSRSSEALYLTMDAQHQHATLQVFLRLIRLGPGSLIAKRRARLTELTALRLDPVLLSEVLEEFGRRRLLTFDRDASTGEATVEVAHEALLTEWDRLAQWTEGHRTDLRRHAALAAAVEEWVASDHDPDYLFVGGRLAETEEWAARTTLDLTATELDFLDASLHQRSADAEAETARTKEQHRLERRARTRLLALVGAVALLAGAITFAILAWPGDSPPDAVLLGNEPVAFRELLADGFDQGLADFGVSGEKVTPNGPEPSAKDVEALSERGSDLIITLTFPSECDEVDPVTRSRPETSYVLFDCPGEQPNVAYVSFATEQGSFLAGAAAALQSQTGVIGFIGAVDHPFIWPYQAGFEAGARAVDPDIDIRSTYLRRPPDGLLFENDARAFEVAEEMYRDGADIIYGTAGGLSTGVIQAAVQLSDELARHLWVIGVDTDIYASLSGGNPWSRHVLTSMMKRYDRAAYAALEEYSRAVFTPGARTLDLSTDSVGLAESGGFIDDIRDQLDDLRAQIVSGDINVPTIPADKEDEAAEQGITPESAG